MTDPKAPKASTSPVNAEERLLQERRKADAEARRRIEEANREAQERIMAYEARRAAMREAERAEEEEKAAEKRAKAAARKAAAEEKAAARKASAEEKAAARKAAAEQKAAAQEAAAEEKASVAEARAAAAQEKQALKAQQAEAKTRLQELTARLKEEARAQSKEHGAPFAELVGAFVRVFSKRTDIELLSQGAAAPVDAQELLKHARLPADVLCFYQSLGALQLQWRFQGEERVVASLALPTLDELDQERLDRDPPEQDESRGSPVPTKSQVQRAFIAAEQHADWLRLLETSALRWSTSACLVSALLKQRPEEEQGLEEKQAKALVSFLGEHACVLLPRLGTDEGKRRSELMQGIAADAKLNRRLVEAINQGPALDKAQCQKLLAEHKRFLENGGAGGQFTLEVQYGLPVLRYAASSEVLGQALISCENLNGAKFDDAKLSFAGLSGIRAEKVSFARADLSYANLSYAVLNRAQFSSAILTECDLTGCKLAGANFRGADLTGTNFELADLTGANFAGAILKNTRFGGAMVRDVKY